MSKFNEKIIRFLTKLYYSIKGIIKTMFLRKGCVYKSDKLKDTNEIVRRYYYKGDNTFFITTNCIERTYGVQFMDSKLHKYKNWELGILDFKLDNNVEIFD